MVGLDPSRLGVAQVDTQTERAIVDSDEFAVAKEALADGVYQLLIGDGEKLPFANGLDGFKLCGRDFYLAVVRERYVVVSIDEVQAGGDGDDQRSEEHTSELQSRQYLVC